MLSLFVYLFIFFTYLSTTRLYRGQIPRLTSDNFSCCHTRDRAERPWLVSQPFPSTWHKVHSSQKNVDSEKTLIRLIKVEYLANCASFQYLLFSKHIQIKSVKLKQKIYKLKVNLLYLENSLGDKSMCILLIAYLLFTIVVCLTFSQGISTCVIYKKTN